MSIDRISRYLVERSGRLHHFTLVLLGLATLIYAVAAAFASGVFGTPATRTLSHLDTTWYVSWPACMIFPGAGAAISTGMCLAVCLGLVRFARGAKFFALLSIVYLLAALILEAANTNTNLTHRIAIQSGAPVEPLHRIVLQPNSEYDTYLIGRLRFDSVLHLHWLVGIVLPTLLVVSWGVIANRACSVPGYCKLCFYHTDQLHTCPECGEKAAETEGRDLAENNELGE